MGFSVSVLCYPPRPTGETRCLGDGTEVEPLEKHVSDQVYSNRRIRRLSLSTGGPPRVLGVQVTSTFRDDTGLRLVPSSNLRYDPYFYSRKEQQDSYSDTGRWLPVLRRNFGLPKVAQRSSCKLRRVVRLGSGLVRPTVCRASSQGSRIRYVRDRTPKSTLRQGSDQAL